MNASKLVDDRAMLHSTIGGLSDTELKLLAVMPTSRPSASTVVTMVTPVVKLPSACRNCFASKLPVIGKGSAMPVKRLCIACIVAALVRHRSEEHTSELQSLMRNSYAVFCLTKKTTPSTKNTNHNR